MIPAYVVVVSNIAVNLLQVVDAKVSVSRFLRSQAQADANTEDANEPPVGTYFSSIFIWIVMLLLTGAICSVIGLCRRLKYHSNLPVARTIAYREDLINENEIQLLWPCWQCEFSNYAHRTNCALCGCERAATGDQALKNTPNDNKSRRGANLSRTGTVLSSSRESASSIVLISPDSDDEVAASDALDSEVDTTSSSPYRPLASPSSAVVKAISPRIRRKEWQTVLNKDRQLVWTRKADQADQGKAEEMIRSTAFVSQVKFAFETSHERLTIVTAEHSLVCPLYFVRLSNSMPSLVFEADDEKSPAETEQIGLESTASVDEDFYGVGWMRSKPFPEKHRWFLGNASSILNARWGSPTMSRFDVKLVTPRGPDLLTRAVSALVKGSELELRRPLRIQFEDEPALDAGGVAREWFGLVAKEFLDERRGLFEAVHVTSSAFSANEASGSLAYAINSKASLTVKDHLAYYRAFGRFMGKALLEGHLVQLPMTSVIFKHILGEPLSFSDLAEQDEGLARSLQELWDSTSNESWTGDDGAEHLYGLDFSVFHTAMGTVDLKPNGRNISVTTQNKCEYVKLFVQWHLARSAAKELKEIVLGVHDVLPAELLGPFDFAELRLLLCGLPVLDLSDWKAHTKVAGNLRKSKVEELTRRFWNVVQSMTNEDRERILLFVTGSCRVPVHGFKALTTSDGRLCAFTLHWLPRSECLFPRAHTCFNRLDLPMYDSEQDLHEALHLVVQMDVTGFTIQ